MRPLVARLEEAYRLHAGGQTSAAERIYREILAAEPTNEHALNLLGVICITSGRAAEAHEVMARAARTCPDNPDTQHNYGLALHNIGQYGQSAAAFARSLTLRPNHPLTLNSYGSALGMLHRSQEAVAAFHEALRLAPDYPECQYNLSAALAAQRQYAHALQAVERALALRPDFAEAHNSRGEILTNLLRFEDAVQSFRRALVLTPSDDAVWINLTAALRATGEHAEARRILEGIVARDDGNARALNNLGTLLEQLGDPTRAASYFRQALTHSPHDADSYYQLSRLDATQIGAMDLEHMQSLLAAGAITDEDRVSLVFALANVAEARGEVDVHFHYLSEGKELKRQQAPYDRGEIARYYESLKRAFSIAPARRAAESRCAELPRVVFVLGMPRSGTSLIEQILATHPAIVGGGELGLVENTVSNVRKLTGRDFPEGIATLDIEVLYRLGEQYLSRLVQRAGQAPLIVDKTPMNSQYIGLLASILPEAQFIHCTRSPMDNCWSIFKLLFTAEHSYAHDLQSLGEYYRQRADLMAHWRDLLGDRILEVMYEDTVTDLEGQCRRILKFLNLDYDPAVLNFFENKRLVTTPSASQVRRPIYRDSIGSWRPYARHLQPLAAALGPTFCGRQ